MEHTTAVPEIRSEGTSAAGSATIDATIRIFLSAYPELEPYQGMIAITKTPLARRLPKSPRLQFSSDRWLQRHVLVYRARCDSTEGRTIQLWIWLWCYKMQSSQGPRLQPIPGRQSTKHPPTLAFLYGSWGRSCNEVGNLTPS